jgi:hypothetical protein
MTLSLDLDQIAEASSRLSCVSLPNSPRFGGGFSRANANRSFRVVDHSWASDAPTFVLLEFAIVTQDIPAVSLYDPNGQLRQLNDIEADVILHAIGFNGGSVTETARRLRIGRSTLYRKIERYQDVMRRADRGSLPKTNFTD